MDILYSISAAAMFLGVCVTTIRRWERAGNIKCFRTVGGHRRFSLSEIRRVLLGRKRRENVKKIEKQAIVYARVSTHGQKPDLLRQQSRLEDYCVDNNLKIVASHRDIGSGLNAKRRGLLKLLKTVSRGGITHVIISYRDRLTRFGFTYLETFCQYFGTQIIPISNKAERSMEEELVEDLVAIVTSFSGRLHGMRNSKKRKDKLNSGL